MNTAITIRRSTVDDEVAMRRLAALDSRRPLHGEALLAFSGTELRAALPLHGGEPIADPFHPTAAIVDLLRMRASHLGAPASSRRRRLAILRLRTA